MPPIEIWDALRIVDHEFTAIPKALSEFVALQDLTNRHLANDVSAPFDHPPAAVSLRDGVVFSSLETDQSLPATAHEHTSEPIFHLVGSVLPGQVNHVVLAPGTAARIMTGATIPPGGSGVAMAEDVDWLIQADNRWQVLESNWQGAESATHVRIKTPLVPGAFILPQGSIFHQNQRLLPAGARINPVMVGLLASAGMSQVLCRRVPRIAILTTGDELATPGTERNSEQIFNSNGPLLSAALNQAGFSQVEWQHRADSESDITDWLQTRLGKFDLLLTTGAVSAGKKDCLPSVFRQLGVHTLFHGVKIKPGKPVFLGRWEQANQNDTDEKYRTTYLLGLPGNPISVWVTFQLFVNRVLGYLSGAPHELKWFKAELNSSGDFQDSRLTFWPGKIDWTGQPWATDSSTVTPSLPQVSPLPWLGSPDIFAPTQANCLIYFPPHSRQIEPGTAVTVMLL